MTYKDKKIGVTIPAYNEEKLIIDTLMSIPNWIDVIVIINDKSKDKTGLVVKQFLQNDLMNDEHRIFHLINHEVNTGVGGAIISGHKFLQSKNCDIFVVMAGDNQMDPNFLDDLLTPILTLNYDYAKGNRFFGEDSLRNMPAYRKFGNYILSFLNKFGTGYWSIFDPQNGYTAIKNDTFSKLNKNRLNKRYNFENSILVELNVIGATVADVSIPAVYGREQSTINLFSFIPKTILNQLRYFISRNIRKNYYINYNPIGTYYLFGLFSLLFSFFWAIWILFHRFSLQENISNGTYLLFFIPLLLGFTSFQFAITQEINEEKMNILHKKLDGLLKKK
ncbi:MAG: glycosyltransferase family 2 protein [Candidatus Heimdallarchaeota archaeon]|nr:glycosyltransferase family 2 protein [Candidatus Heimdallarchaeota archaeon]MDH5647777.1 glycosyltransferase family 2 protein [Candidatus Heimdallarchaeota archaeon]